MLSVDPGVRTFSTCYDSSGYIYEWGNGDKSRLMRLGHAMDKLQSRCDDGTCRHKERYKLRQKMGRIQEKIRSLVDDLQRKCIKWIVTNFTHVIFPPFNGHNMNSKGQRKIRSKTVRAMMMWADGRFRTRVLSKVREYTDCRIYVHNEAYTSKTCGSCGHVHAKLGGNKLFHCPSCGVIMDRDANGARNILLRFLTECEGADSEEWRPLRLGSTL